MIKKVFPCLLVLPVLALSACGGGGVKETLGLTKSAPDEFAVVKRAPLSMPPDYSLRPPQPGAARPQEQTTSAEAQQTVFGGSASTGGSGDGDDTAESSFLKQAGADAADPAIRNQVDIDAKENTKDNRPVVKKLMGGLGGDSTPPATVVDAKAEAERLRKNKEEGKPVTAGETPSIDQ